MFNIVHMEITKRIKEKIDTRQLTKLDLAKELGISRVTLDTRLEKGNWKKAEIYLLKKIA